MKTHWPEHATPSQRAATDELLRRLRAEYAGRILFTALFGSVARGDASPESDIDVLVVTDEADSELKRDIWRTGSRVSLEFDVVFNLHVISRAHFSFLREKQRTLWRNIEQDGIALAPEPVPA